MTTKLVAKAKAVAPASTAQITDLVHKIENLSSTDAFTEATALIDNIDCNYFQLGGILAVIQAKGWHSDKGHANFKECVEKDFSMRYRKAMYLVQIYTALVNSGVDWEKVKHLGWTKLKELAPILTKENCDDLVSKAEGMTVLQLQQYVESLQAPTGEGSELPTAATGLTTLTFKVHPDQKATIKDAIDKAKKEHGTDVDAVALEAMSMDFLNTVKGAKAKKADPKDVIKGLGYEKTLEIFGLLWPDIVVQCEVPEEMTKDAQPA